VPIKQKLATKAKANDRNTIIMIALQAKMTRTSSSALPRLRQVMVQPRTFPLHQQLGRSFHSHSLLPRRRTDVTATTIGRMEKQLYNPTSTCTSYYTHRSKLVPAATAGSTREIHFLPLLGLWGAKHLSMWTLYNASKQYGWHRVYRRLLEQNRATFPNNKQQQATVQSILRMAIQSPPKVVSQLGKHASVVVPYLQALAERAEPAMPRFLVAAAKVIVQSQKPIKILQDLVSAQEAAASSSKTKLK